VSVPPEKLAEINAEKGGLIKKFKLESSVSTTNMHLFDENGVIVKYDSVHTILSAFFDIRSSFYQKRKVQLVAKLTEEWDKLDNKVIAYIYLHGYYFTLCINTYMYKCS
jgi:DNA gyrase/topoisomerase IV subunit A